MESGRPQQQVDPMVEVLTKAYESAKAAAKARADAIRAKADQVEAEQYGNFKMLGYSVLANFSPDTMRRVADRVERTREKLSEAIRALVEAGLDATQKEAD